MMKRILLSALLLAAIGCSKPDKIAEQIKMNIQENAGGVDMNYKPVETKEIMALNYGQFIDFINMTLETNETPDELKKRVDFIIQDAKDTENVDTYHIFKFIKSGLEKYEAAGSRDSIYFKLIEHKYTINNPMLENMLVNVTNYYYFNSRDSLIGKVGDAEYKEAKRNYIKNDNEAEIFLLFEAIK